MSAATEVQLVQLGERLRLARLRRRLSMEGLAAAAGVSRLTVLRIEKGAPSVAMGAYARLLEALGLADDLGLLVQLDAPGRKLQDQMFAPRRAKTSERLGDSSVVLRETAEAMWDFKRRNQRQDIDAIAAARTSNAAMSWFTEERAAKAEIVGEPL